MEPPQDSRKPAFFAWKPAAADGPPPAVSVVAPMHNEAGAASDLIREISVALGDINHEIIVIDDGSDDDTLAVLKAAQRETPQLRVLRHEKNAGQSRALRTGVLAARSDIVAMLDGDGQNDPADLKRLISALRESEPASGVAMAAGERRERKDALGKRWASIVANSVRRRLLRDGAIDTGCGLKVFYREAFLRLPYFDHMHRYLPALMRREGFGVVFAPVSHRPRSYGNSKYSNIGRLLAAVRDLSGMFWLVGRARSPGAINESEE